jgi:hypothetical protein
MHGKNAAAAMESISQTRMRVIGATDDSNLLSVKIPAGVTSADFIQQHISSTMAKTLSPTEKHNFTMCALEHGWSDSCIAGGFQVFAGELSRSAKLYLPLNVVGVMAVVVNSNRR